MPVICSLESLPGLCKDVTIYGEGIIDGNASWENWWFEAKKIRIAARPRMIFFEPV